MTRKLGSILFVAVLAAPLASVAQSGPSQSSGFFEGGEIVPGQGIRSANGSSILIADTKADVESIIGPADSRCRRDSEDPRVGNCSYTFYSGSAWYDSTSSRLTVQYRRADGAAFPDDTSTRYSGDYVESPSDQVAALTIRSSAVFIPPAFFWGAPANQTWTTPEGTSVYDVFVSKPSGLAATYPGATLEPQRTGEQLIDRRAGIRFVFSHQSYSSSASIQVF